MSCALVNVHNKTIIMRGVALYAYSLDMGTLHFNGTAASSQSPIASDNAGQTFRLPKDRAQTSMNNCIITSCTLCGMQRPRHFNASPGLMHAATPRSHSLMATPCPPLIKPMKVVPLLDRYSTPNIRHCKCMLGHCGICTTLKHAFTNCRRELIWPTPFDSHMRTTCMSGVSVSVHPSVERVNAILFVPESKLALDASLSALDEGAVLGNIL
jgi:hypothetical protein